jgi:hypothetical protein
MADTLNPSHPGERKPGMFYNAAGKCLGAGTWELLPHPALAADRYGAGRGIYLDPEEHRAAEATAELLFRIRLHLATRRPFGEGDKRVLVAVLAAAHPPAEPALRAHRYGAGIGVYLDPAEQRAAQATAELLFRIRRAAAASAGRPVKAKRRARHG